MPSSWCYPVWRANKPATRRRPRTDVVFRLIFVFSIIGVGALYSLRGPFYALLFYLWNAYFRPEFWVWNDLLFSFRLSLIIYAFLLASSIPSFSKFRWNRQLILIALFFAQTVVSLMMSQYFDLIYDFWIEFLKVIGITLLITLLVDDEKRYRMTIAVIAFSLGFEAAKQGWAQFVLNPGATNSNTHVMLGDNNGVALGMIMLIPLFMALSQTASRQAERAIHRFFIAGVFYRAISTYSRGGFLSAGVVSLISLARAKHKIRTLIAVGVLAYAVSSVMPQSFWDRMNTISAEGDDRDVSAQSRLYYWGLAREMAADYPLTGVGFNGFRYAFAGYDALKAGEGGQRAVHSVWFGLLSELGYPGLMLFIAILAGSLLSCQRIRKRAKLEGRENIAIYASHLQTTILVFIVGGSFLNAQYLELIWHIVALTVALERISVAAPVTATAPVEAKPTRVRVSTMPRYVPETARLQQER